MSQFVQDNCTKHIHGYPLREFVSSGLTHSWGVFSFPLSLVTNLRKVVQPLDYIMPLNYRGTKRAQYFENNFGIIDFHLDQVDPNNDVIVWETRERRGQPVLRKVFKGSDFQ